MGWGGEPLGSAESWGWDAGGGVSHASRLHRARGQEQWPAHSGLRRGRSRPGERPPPALALRVPALRAGRRPGWAPHAGFPLARSERPSRRGPAQAGRRGAGAQAEASGCPHPPPRPCPACSPGDAAADPNRQPPAPRCSASCSSASGRPLPPGGPRRAAQPALSEIPGPGPALPCSCALPGREVSGCNLRGGGTGRSCGLRSASCQKPEQHGTGPRPASGASFSGKPS